MNARMIKAAKRYAQADRSDPFAYRRCITHINNGIASLYTKEGKEGFYEAEEARELRSIPNGKGGFIEYQATVYRNLVRP